MVNSPPVTPPPAAPPEIRAPSHTTPHPLTLSALLLTLLTVALWGGNPVATRYATDALPPITVSGLRFVLATLVMVVWCCWERVSFKLEAGQFWPVFIAGFLLFAQIGTFTLGAAWTSSSHASLYVNTFPFWVVGLDHFVTRGDRLTARKLVGLAVAGGGVFWLLLMTAEGHAGPQQRDLPSVAGDVMLLFSAFLLGVKFVYTKVALRVIGATELIFWHDVVAVALFAVTAAFFERPDFTHVPASAWWGLIYQGIFVGGLCFAIQAHILKRHSASQIAVFSFATPLFGMLLGMLLRGDRMTLWLAVAGIAVAAGIYLVNRKS